MRGLPQKFTKYGQQFEQLCRTSDTAIYLRHINARQKSYEVVVVRVADKKPEKVNGAIHFVTCEPYECYPSSEKWGSCGWTYSSEEDARAKFDLLSDPAFKLPAPPLYPIKVPAQRTALRRTAPFAPRVSRRPTIAKSGETIMIAVEEN
jgi:hypothetical protein